MDFLKLTQNAIKSVTETATKATEAVGSAASAATQSVTETAVMAGGAIGDAAAYTGQIVVRTAVGVGEGSVSVASQATKVVTETVVVAGGAIGGAALQVTERVGHAIDSFQNNPQFKEITKKLQVDWLIDFINTVDIVKAEAEVKRLQQQYPDKIPSEIAHDLMLDKALLAGGTGLATSLVPGAAAVLFAVDFTASCALQAEMVYQIACAYGLDIGHPDRKGEILAVFGLSFGGTQAVKAGLNYAAKAGVNLLMKNIPIAGAVIGASSNAAMIYALGYAACRFYEAKINPLDSQAALTASVKESDKYLESAIAQEVIMDQILVHIILAGNPDTSWEKILPELQTLNLSPESLETIANNINSPVPLKILLDQINSDFAKPLLSQCQKIAQLDNVITPGEAMIIETITKKLS